MIRVFFGNDVVKIRNEAVIYADSFNIPVENVGVDDYISGTFNNMATAVSLFGDQKVFLLDNISQNKEAFEELLSALELMAGSQNHFVIIEGNLLAAVKKQFNKYVDEIEEFKAVSDKPFNTFAVADALSLRDKKSLWLLFNQALIKGVATENIIGILWWQLKTMRLAKLTGSAAEAGLKDYPFNKAKRALQKFKEGELEKLSHSLIALQHDSRLGICELNTALERWILKL